MLTFFTAPNSERGLRIVVVLTMLAATSCASLLCAPASSGNPDGTIDKPLKGVYRADSSFYQAGLTASDIDADGEDEILVGNTNGRLYCFNARAELEWHYNVGGRIQGAPACYDVDGDGRQEVWVGDLNGRMWGFDCKGRVLSEWGWPKMTPSTGGFVGIFSSPAIGDVNGDGSPDIVVGTYGHTVECWSYTGHTLPGWPYNNKDTIWSSPALADIDWDGLPEIVIGADSTGGSGWPYPPGGLLYVFNGDGTIVPGFPRVTPEVTWSSPAVADIDGDGRYEIVVGTGHYYKATGRLSTEGHRVYAYNHDGSDVPGWPATAAGSTFSSPAIGDIDGDGSREVVIACNGMRGIGEDRISVFRADGKPMWSLRGFGGPMMGSPALGDITGDGLADVILGSGWQICAWDYTGRILWSQGIGNYVVTSPVVGDFDRDGRVEVALGTGDAPEGSVKGGNFYVFDMGRCAARARGAGKTLFPWPCFHKNARNSGTVLTGGEPPPPPPAPPHANFHEYILLMNPNRSPAVVNIEFTNEKGEKAAATVSVGPRSRKTVYVNKYMSGCGVSARVESSEPIVGERAMYFNFQGRWQGGTGASGEPSPARKWYLAEGYTADNFDGYVLVQNPGRRTATVRMTFMREGREPVEGRFAVGPQSRFTLNLKDVPGLENTSVSTAVESSADVVCERAMYFDYQGNIGGHVSQGVPEPARRWYLAEGYTASGYDTYVLVQNPGREPAGVAMHLLRGDGHRQKLSFVLPGRSRKTVKVDDVPGFEAAEVSTEVRSDRGVIAERAVYFNADGRDGGHACVGVTEPADTWYMAEGYTGGTFDTYILLMNPEKEAVRVRTTLMRPDGRTWSRVDRLPPRSRSTLHLDEMPGFEDTEVSTLVECTSGAGIIAERAMYFSYNDAYPGGHDAAGVSRPSRTWYFAEGYTGL